MHARELCVICSRHLASPLRCNPLHRQHIGAPAKFYVLLALGVILQINSLHDDQSPVMFPISSIV